MLDPQIASAIIAAIAAITVAIISNHYLKQSKYCAVTKRMLFKRYCDMQYLFKTRKELLERLSQATGTPELTLLKEVNKKLQSEGLAMSPSSHPEFINKVVNNGIDGIDEFIKEKQ